MSTYPRKSVNKNGAFLRLVGINLAFIVLFSLVFIGFAEVYYRYFYDTSDSFALSKNARRWFERHYQYNNLDARDNVDYFPASSPGKKRLSFIGDSFTAGHGVKDVEDRFANIIRRQKKNDLDVLVLAQGGFETGREVFVLEKFIREGFVRDTVVLVYCLNDINDLIPESGAIHGKIRVGMDSEGFLLKNSYFFNTYYYRLRAILDPNISNYYAFVKDAYSSELWQQQQSRLYGFYSICKQYNLNLVVVTFPFLNALGDNYEYEDVHRQLDLFWQKLSVPHLDLTNVYRDYDASELVVGKYDAHPNEFAHKLAADAISGFLEGKL